MKTAIVLGTRPEIIKLAPIISKLKKSTLIFTGQHYDYEMGMKFIDQLGIRKPDYSLKISHSTPAIQIGEISIKLSKILEQEKPDTVIVQGDTNTVLASGLCSLKSNMPVSHIEAGLRSFDWRMPEEHNRIAIDHISEFLFAPTIISKNNLLSEQVHGKIAVTGNTVIDSINKFSKISTKKSNLMVDLDNFILLTLHRSENVDNPKVLSSIIKAIIDSNEDYVFPVHPRTKKCLNNFGFYKKLLNSKNVIMIDTIGYFEMLELMKNCKFILSDSGGIQEEATAPSIKKKVVVIRKTTDRPEAVNAGFSEITGTSYSSISNSIKRNSKNHKIPNKKSPYGTGDAAQKIISYLRKNL